MSAAAVDFVPACYALRRLKLRFRLYAGAGAASVGIARIVKAALLAEGVEPDAARRAQLLCDTQGVLSDARPIGSPHKREFAASAAMLHEMGFTGEGPFDLLAAVRTYRPTVLIGATAKAGMFSEELLTEMGRGVERPLIFPFSNPTTKSECTPEEAIRCTNGRAIVATGSPFAPVTFAGREHVIGQGNNVFIFPGVGLGCVLSEAHEVPDAFFLAAARTLAEFTPADRLERGAVYPDQSDLREVSRRIAEVVIREARERNLGRMVPDREVEKLLREAMWYPDYA